MQYTGAYKVRGAYYKISTLTEEEQEQGPDYRLRRATMPRAWPTRPSWPACKATIVMPTTTPLIKVNRTKSYGAEVVLYGRCV